MFSRSSFKVIWAIKNSAKLNYYTGSAAVSIDSNYMHVSTFARVCAFIVTKGIGAIIYGERKWDTIGKRQKKLTINKEKGMREEEKERGK